MGEWMMFPGADGVIAERVSRFGVPRPWWVRRGGTERICNLSVISGVLSNFDKTDVANLADVGDVPLWECEIPSSDDGF